MIENFYKSPLMDLTKSIRWILSSFLLSLELGFQTSPISKKGILLERSDMGGRSLLNWIIYRISGTQS